MKLRTKLLGAAAGLCLLSAAAIAQSGYGVPTLFITSPLGTESITVLDGGAQLDAVTINQIRNAEGYVLAAAGTTVTTTMANTQAVAIATGAITTWNVVLPASPYDGELAKTTCPGGNVGTLAVTATSPSGVTIVGTLPTSCTASSNTDAGWVYNLSGNIWYRTE